MFMGLLFISGLTTLHPYTYNNYKSLNVFVCCKYLLVGSWVFLRIFSVFALVYAENVDKLERLRDRSKELYLGIRVLGWVR